MGVILPLTGIAPPMPLFLKHQTPQFEVVSQLDRELDDLILQKQEWSFSYKAQLISSPQHKGDFILPSQEGHFET